MSLTPIAKRLLHATSQRITAGKRTSPSADRNSQPIAAALLEQVNKQTPNLQLLEIASGSGQHAGHVAPLLPNIVIQPTEFERSHFTSIQAYASDCVTQNIKPPLYVDIRDALDQWAAETLEAVKPGSFDYMFNSNMMHISPWACSVGLFRSAGQLLKPSGKLFTYGPYAQDGVLAPQSNVDFDAALRRQNNEWGVRDIRDLKQLAEQNGLRLESVKDMPSNNKFLTWLKL